VLSLVVGGAFVFTVLNPQPSGRERASIESKAEILYETQTIDAPALVTPPAIQSTARDPLMLPLFERHVYALLGSVSHRWARIWSPLAYAGLLLSFAGILGRRTSAARGWMTATALSLTPVMLSRESGVISALSEIPTTCFHGAAVLCLWDAWQAPPGRERIRGMLLASGMASSACFVQNEGVTLLVIDCLTWCLAALGGGVRLSGDRPDEDLRPRGPRHLFAIILFALFAAILLTPWMRYRAALPSTRAWLGPAVLEHIETPIPSTNLTQQISDLLRRLIQEWWSWPFAGWLLLFAVLGRPRRSWAEPQRFLLLSLLSSATVLILMWAMAPEGLKELMGPVSHRSFIPLIPVAILFVASVWRAPLVTPRDRP